MYWGKRGPVRVFILLWVPSLYHGSDIVQRRSSATHPLLTTIRSQLTRSHHHPSGGSIDSGRDVKTQHHPQMTMIRSLTVSHHHLSGGSLNNGRDIMRHREKMLTLHHTRCVSDGCRESTPGHPPIFTEPSVEDMINEIFRIELSRQYPLSNLYIMPSIILYNQAVFGHQSSDQGGLSGP